MTHRFHPLYGREFEFVVHRQNWGEDRVHMRDEGGRLFSVPAGWTDVAPVDPFVAIAAGRCPFTPSSLLAVAEVIDRVRSLPTGVAPSRRLCRDR
ncbi:MAG: Y4bD/Y4pK family protein [Actinomycetota bacterium]|nr:Y4bD/Y4pK family protein [Actinomycetota bacterium]